MKNSLKILTLSFASLAATHAYATATVTDYWSLGESETGPNYYALNSVGSTNFNAGLGTVTVDSTKTSGLNGSTASLSFASAYQYMNATAVSMPSDNWIAELSFFVTSVPGTDKTLLNLGSYNTPSAVLRSDGHLWFAQQGVGYRFDAGAITTNAWTDMAWVKDNGVSKFYVNGTLVGTDSTSIFGTAGGALFLGTAPGGGSNFTGNLDNLRISTFSAGQFNAGTDLLQLAAVPEPSTYGLIGAGVLAGLTFVRRRRRLAA